MFKNIQNKINPFDIILILKFIFSFKKAEKEKKNVFINIKRNIVNTHI